MRKEFTRTYKKGGKTKTEDVLVQKHQRINLQKYEDFFEDGEYKDVEIQRLEIKAEWWPKIWYSYHEKGGHWKGYKTFKTLHPKYNATRLHDLCIDTCKACPCPQSKVMKNKQSKAPMRNLPPGKRKCKYIHVDFWGKCKLSWNGNEWGIIAVCRSTGWVEGAPLPNKIAPLVAYWIYAEVYCRFAAVSVIISDNDKSFVNKVMEELCVKHEISHHRIIAGRPQGNSPAESNVKLTKRGICTGIYECYKSGVIQPEKNYKITKRPMSWDRNWCKLVPVALLYVRTGVQRGRGMSPFKALYGDEPLFAVDHELLKDAGMLEELTDAEEKLHLMEGQERMKEALAVCLRTLVKCKKQAAQAYNKRRGEDFQPKVGDKVKYCKKLPNKTTGGEVLWYPLRSQKAHAAYYEVFHIDQLDRATLKDVDGNILKSQSGEILKFHVERLKRHFDPKEILEQRKAAKVKQKGRNSGKTQAAIAFVESDSCQISTFSYASHN